LVGLEGRDLRDGEVYTLMQFLDQLFMCFIFWQGRKNNFAYITDYSSLTG